MRFVNFSIKKWIERLNNMSAMLCYAMLWNLAEYTSEYRKNNHIKGKLFFLYAIQTFIVPL